MTQIQYRDPKESEAQLKSFAYRVLRRLHRLGACSATLDDVQQELWFAWCKACEAYRPECGASFRTFLHRGMQLHINRWVEKSYERFHDETIALSLDYEMGGGNSDDDGDFGSVVPDSRPLQDVEVENEQCFAYAMTRISERARMFITILKNQPPELLAEVRRVEHKAQYAKERGVAFSAAHRLTSAMVFDFMGASRTERKSIMDELAHVSAIISRHAA